MAADAQPFFDAHFHVIDPAFPLVADQGYLPEPFRADDYRTAADLLLDDAGFAPAGGAVVSGSFQGDDQCYLEAALGALGPGYVGVTQLPPDTRDGELLRLHAIGVRALRANLVRAQVDDLDALVGLALRARVVVGWHLELYVRSVDLRELLPLLPDPDGLVVDHLGLTAAGLPALLALVDEGARVKATGFSRGDLDVAAALRRVYDRNPGALLAGTDLPCTRSPRPVDVADMRLLRGVFDDEELAQVVQHNATSLYRINQP
ncbi:MAG TPA: amidohydrolase family protein [Kineosporiaceae bacterium]|nr:amidohydrolase family protein [Kineosporiaceae bacterium]